MSPVSEVYWFASCSIGDSSSSGKLSKSFVGALVPVASVARLIDTMFVDAVLVDG